VKSVFDFETLPDYLQALRMNYPGLRKPIPYAKWAKILGYSSTRSIEMVVQGRRSPSAAMLRGLSQTLLWTSSEFEYAQGLITLARLRKLGRSTAAIEKRLHDLHPRFNRRYIGEEAANLLRNWWTGALYHLSESRDFRSDLKWMFEKLGRRIPIFYIQRSLDTLVVLGLLEVDADGQYRTSTQEALYTPDDVPSDSVRAHHKQMLSRASEALVSQDVSAREFISFGMALDPASVPELKSRMREIRDQLVAEFGSRGGSEVHQINMQLFSITQKLK
jgi:uncharacterized protein (TIGR02147 family)